MKRIDLLNVRRTTATALATASCAAALLVALAFAADSTAAPAQAAGSSRGSACSNADRPAAEATPLELRRSVRCLINAERELRGRGRLQRSKPLQRAAQRHAGAMVETGCLAHQCGDEPELPVRIENAGYLEGADAWQFAESTGCGASAQAMVDNWMASKFHRVNILERGYGDVGVGVVQEPVDERCDHGYATFAVVFGWRTPVPAS